MDDNVYPGDQARLIVGRPYYLLKWGIDTLRYSFANVVASCKNWWDAIFVYLGMKRSARIAFKDGRIFQLTKSNFPRLLSLTDFYTLPEDVTNHITKIGKDGFTAKVNNFTLKLPFEATSVIKEILEDRHSGTDSKGKVVVDVGAYNGDSPIYYIVKEGARHVYGYEPVGYLYEMAKKIVKENGLDKRITLFKTAITSGSYKSDKNSGFDSGNEDSNGIKTTTLENVVRMVGRDAILKLDCEGYEYGILQNATKKTLRSFGTIYVEYHYGYKDIIDTLKNAGFSVSHTRPRYGFKGFGKKAMILGIIVAKRK
jgi:FkbM family methyltransferase